MKNANGKGFNKDRRQSSSSQKAKTKGRRMLRKVVSTLFLQDLSALAVKDSKLQRLTTSFEEVKMKEDESFDEFYVKLKDIINSAFNLGETIPQPERFHAKIMVIEDRKSVV